MGLFRKPDPEDTLRKGAVAGRGPVPERSPQLDGVFPEFENETFTAPHCDASVLHAPGECKFCDHYPQRQADRVAQRINFTGQADPDKAPCPSEAFRPVDTVHRWPGNRPAKVLDHDFVPPLEHHHGVVVHMTAQDLDHLRLPGPDHTEPGHTHPFLPTSAVYEDACGEQFPPDTSFCGQPAWMHHDWTGMYGARAQEELANALYFVSASGVKPMPEPTFEQLREWREAPTTTASAATLGPNEPTQSEVLHPHDGTAPASAGEVLQFANVYCHRHGLIGAGNHEHAATRFHMHRPHVGDPSHRITHAHSENDVEGHDHVGMFVAIYDPVLGDSTPTDGPPLRPTGTVDVISFWPDAGESPDSVPKPFTVSVTSEWFEIPPGPAPDTVAAAFQELRFELSHLWDELTCVVEAAAKVVRRWWRS